jgi:cysteinyl-tRNA synthetase
MTPTLLPLQFYNTLTNTKQPFTPLASPAVTLYACGPTVYDDAHLGHARCYLAWDALVRVLRWGGYDLTYARNITDVDDKILNKAAAEGCTPQALAERFTQRFTEDMASLNTLPPDVEPRATQHIEAMHALIQRLEANGLAYTSSMDGTVYYRTQAKADYGKLSGRTAESRQAGARVDVAQGKEHPDDFALWKPVDAEEAQQEGHAWPSPWGEGRPGWHLECSAMNHSLFGTQLDIHTGGADLIFPHHENEIAQSEGAWGCQPYAQYWLHNGFVQVSGEKMSKSLGNFTTVRGLLQAFSPNALRLFIASHHYRSPVDFTHEALEAAQTATDRLAQTIHTLGLADRDPAFWNNPEQWLPWPLIEATVPAFVEALADDVNVPKALAETYAYLKRPTSDADVCATLLAVLGVHPANSKPLGYANQQANALANAHPALQALATTYGVNVSATASPTEVLEALVVHRSHVKQAKQWAESDAIRNALAEVGITLKDAKTGDTTWHV